MISLHRCQQNSIVKRNFVKLRCYSGFATFLTTEKYCHKTDSPVNSRQSLVLTVGNKKVLLQKKIHHKNTVAMQLADLFLLFTFIALCQIDFISFPQCLRICLVQIGQKYYVPQVQPEWGLNS